MRRAVCNFVCVVASVLVALLVAEAIVRLLHVKPETPVRHMENWAEIDPSLGWRARPGIHLVECEQQAMTIEPGGLRRTTGRGPNNPSAPREVIVILGGSWFLGFGVKDEETLASQLQERFPDVLVLNYACPGYGTYQCLIKLESLFRAQKFSVPVTVLYEFSDNQIIRSVAGYEWIRGLSTYDGTHFEPPHIIKDESGEWRKYRSRKYNLLSLADKSHLIYLIQDRVIYATTKGRKSQAMAATVHCLSEMNSVCKANAASLVTIYIHGPPNFVTHIQSYCKKSDIEFVNCFQGIPWQHPDFFLCAGASGHPNARLNKIWADCVSEYLLTNR
jgi:hypothetical protein